MKKFPINHRWKQRLIKITLLNLDESISEMKLYSPVITMWVEVAEPTANHLQEMIMDLTRHWLQIVSFKIDLGRVDAGGSEIFEPEFSTQFVIPLDKIFIPGLPGKWLSIEDVRKENEAIKYQVINIKGTGASMFYLN